MPPPAIGLEQITAAHQLYCQLTGQSLRLGFDRERQWYEWLRAGFTPQDLRRVIAYLQREVRENRRNVGSRKTSTSGACASNPCLACRPVPRLRSPSRTANADAFRLSNRSTRSSKASVSYDHHQTQPRPTNQPANHEAPSTTHSAEKSTEKRATLHPIRTSRIGVPLCPAGCPKCRKALHRK